VKAPQLLVEFGLGEKAQYPMDKVLNRIGVPTKADVNELSLALLICTSKTKRSRKPHNLAS
jgi:hypothetical protein